MPPQRGYIIVLSYPLGQRMFLPILKAYGPGYSWFAECNVVMYVDNVVTYRASLIEHMGYIRQLFDRLEKVSLVVSLPRCELGKGQVTYLGHQVG